LSVEPRRRRSRTFARWIGVAAGVTLASGCAIADINRARSHEWTKEGATAQDLATDRYACMKESERSGFWFGTGGLIHSRAAESRRFMACMEARGWK